MSWRIAECVVRGEIDNRLPGLIKGTLYLDGLNSPVDLELEGNCNPDLAGRLLTFRNLRPLPNTSLAGFNPSQCGEAGIMTANRMVRIPTIPDDEVERCIRELREIPTRWSESLFLDWFSEANGRVLIEGSSFMCQLSPAKWTLTDEGHKWQLHLRRERTLFSDDDDELENEGVGESMAGSDDAKKPFALNLSTVSGHHPHALVRRVSEFLIQMIGESKSQRIYNDTAKENQPLEWMFESTSRATIRLAHVMAKAGEPGARFEAQGIILGLRQARWSLGQAAENAGLANHMGSASSEWLEGLRREFRQLRKQIRSLMFQFEDVSQETASGRASTASVGERGGRKESDYVTLSDEEKLKLLQEHSFQAPFESLDQKNWCLHCEKDFDGHSVRVWKDGAGDRWLECGTPDCSGSPIDWAPYPWWDKDHPLTKQHKDEGADIV